MRNKLSFKKDLIYLLQTYALDDYCSLDAYSLSDSVIKLLEDKSKAALWKNQKL